MINPYLNRNSEDLVNIFTGQKAASIELIHARDIGIQAMKEADAKNLHKIPLSKITGFVCQEGAAKKSKTPLLKTYQDETSVTRALCFLQDSDYNKHEAFSYEWTNYPTSLFEPDVKLNIGYKMRKGTKSNFLLSLEREVDALWQEQQALPDSHIGTTYIVDAMAFVQIQTSGSDTFDELQKKY